MKTKTCIFTMLLAVGLTSARAQDTWTRKANFGGTARQHAVGFSIGSKGYIGTGDDGYYKKDLWEYDAAANTWTQKADFGGTARGYAVGFSIGSKGYVGTGYDDNYYKDFWEYDAAANTWTQKADFGGTARGYAVGFSIGSKGYIGTGLIFDPLTHYKDFWEYDPAANAWTQKADFGGTARGYAVGFSIGSKGYVGTGLIFNPVTYYKDFWKYDQTTNTWTQKVDFAGTARYAATGFSVGSKGYVGTGFDDFQKKDLWEYDPAANAWTQKADFGGTERDLAVGFSIGSKGYIGTGHFYNGTTYLYKDFWEYTPEGVSSYRDVILADDPIMFWRLGESSGTIAYDETANHRNASYINNPFLGLRGAIANDTDTSAGFNGVNKYVEWIPTSSYSGPFTVEAWVKEKRVDLVETFFNTRNEVAEFSFDFKLDGLAGKEIRFDVGDGTGWLSTSSVPFDFKRNIWYYVAAVVTTTGATYYVDGSTIDSVTYSGVPLLFDPAHRVQIGTNTRYRTECFHGAVDEVAVYDYALTAAQIAAHYAAGIGN